MRRHIRIRSGKTVADRQAGAAAPNKTGRAETISGDAPCPDLCRNAGPQQSGTKQWHVHIYTQLRARAFIIVRAQDPRMLGAAPRRSRMYSGARMAERAPLASARPPAGPTARGSVGPAWAAREASPLPRRRARRRRLDIVRRPWAIASPAPAHRIGAHRLWGKEMRGRGCGAVGAGCELSTSRIWCSILESSLTSRRKNTSCTRLCR